MPSREHVLHKIRTAVGRNAGQPPAAPPAARLVIEPLEREERIRLMLEHFSGKAMRAGSADEARDYIVALTSGLCSVASRSPLLEELGIVALPGVRVVSGDVAGIRAACAEADIGITTAEYAMADTGALVVLATDREARLVSLLPLVHVTVLSADRILTGLDELFTVLPDPGVVSSSMVLIGGPSRTADIEQILTLGVHGPRELHLVLV